MGFEKEGKFTKKTEIRMPNKLNLYIMLLDLHNKL